MEDNLKVAGQFNWDFLYKGRIDYVDDWFLMSSPTTPILLVAAYLLFVLKIGPAYMKNRPAYSLKNILHVYNVIQVLYSGYIVFIGCRIMYTAGFLETKCINQDKEYTNLIAMGAWFYLIAKLSEFLDTVFFVLRKKWNQISFLHVYHHTFMFSVTWIIFKYSPSHAFVFLCALNSFVHVIMYTYYGLSAFPGLAKHLWWKKYITKLQLVQFLMIIIDVTFNFITSKCPPTYFLLFLAWSNFFFFTYLFGKFYIESYNKNKENTETATKNGRSQDVKSDSHEHEL